MNHLAEIAFSQSFHDLQCQAVVASVGDSSVVLEVRISREDEVLWARRGAEEPEDEWALGCWEDGPAIPCYFGDLDQDGEPEMLVPVPKSDLSPTVYRIFAWNGKELIFVRQAALIADSGGEFVWTTPDPEQDTQITWVDIFDKDTAQIIHARRATISRRLSKLQPSVRGFVEIS